MLYNTIINPYFLYCNIIWGGANQIALKRLLCLQKRAIRLVTKSHYRAASSPIFYDLKILKLEDIHKMQILVFMYKAKHGLLPACCSNLFTLLDDNRRYDCRKKNDFILLKFKSNVRKKCIAVAGPDLWTSIPDYIKDLDSISTIKASLLQLLLDAYK